MRHITASAKWLLNAPIPEECMVNKCATIASLGALTLVSFATAQVSVPVQWPTSTGGNGHWYAVSTAEPSIAQWTSAQTAAGAPGFHLAVVNNAAESQYLITYVDAFPNNLGFWIGYYRISGTTWGWNINQGSTFTLWGGANCGAGPYPNYGYSGFLAALLHRRTDCGWNWDDFAPEITPGRWQLLEYDTDCNNDGIVDYGQIRAGALPDQNANNIPDACECQAHPELAACCPGDINADRTINGADVGILLGYWGDVPPTTPPAVDINHDGVVNGADLGMLLSHWGACP